MLKKKNIKSLLDIRKFEFECIDCSCCRYNETCDITKLVGTNKTLRDICFILRTFGQQYFTASRQRTRYLVIK